MARAKKASTTDAPVLDAAFWAEFGLDASASTRDKLVWLAFAEISRRGILDVNARWLCDLLEVDPSAINYHFGSFDGLIAEVFVVAHELWAESVMRGLAQPAQTPEDRLRNILNSQVERAVRYGSVIGLAHLPHASEQVSVALAERHPGSLARAVEFATGVTALLIRDIRTGEMTQIDFTPDSAPKEQMIAGFAEELAAAARLQWAVVGPTMWMTGAGGGFEEISQLPEPFRADVLWPGFVDRMIAGAKNGWL